MNYPQFKVTVSCMTYNQSKYITDAMNGFTMQKTTFPFVCTIVDDASTDGEQEVIRKYVEQNFDFSEGSVAYYKETDYARITYAQHKTNKNCFFAVLYLKENHYSQKKDKSPYLKEWRDGVEYLAICEGDDYWIVPDKLQKQIELLDANPRAGLTYSKAKVFVDRIKRLEGTIGKEYEGLVNLILSNPIVTLTTCFRYELYLKYLEEIKPHNKKWLLGDLPLWIWIAEKSEIVFYDDIFAVYRLLDLSASHSNTFSRMEEFSNSILDIQLFFVDRYSDKLEISSLREDLINAHCRRCSREALRLHKRKICYQYLKRIKEKSYKDKIKFVLSSNAILFYPFLCALKVKHSLF